MKPPMSADVCWNADEKIIGVVGVAPAATADFYAKLIALTPVKKDWEHVQVIIDSNPKIPSRGRYLELGETDPVPFIRHSIEKLSQMGASIIALPCNTAHILYDRYASDATLQIPNMVAVTVDHALHARPKTAAVFASRLTQQYRLYDDFFERKGVITLNTARHQQNISLLIEKVKQGESLPMLQEIMKAILSDYAADVFILGCTELSLLVGDSFNGVPIIDSNKALAIACLSLSNNTAFSLTTTASNYRLSSCAQA